MVREDQVDWIELVDFDGSAIVFISAIFSSGSALLFTKLASVSWRRVYSGRPELDTNVTDDTGLDKLLTVLEPQMSPVSVPGEDIIFV